MLQVLSELKLTAVLQGSCFWVAVDAATASLLDRCCTGQQDGGPATAREVADIVQAWQVGRRQTDREGSREPPNLVDEETGEGRYKAIFMVKRAQQAFSSLGFGSHACASSPLLPR